MFRTSEIQSSSKFISVAHQVTLQPFNVFVAQFVKFLFILHTEVTSTVIFSMLLASWHEVCSEGIFVHIFL